MLSSNKKTAFLSFLLLYTGLAMAQSGITAAVAATIVTPVTLSKQVDISFTALPIHLLSGKKKLLHKTGAGVAAGYITLPKIVTAQTSAAYMVTGEMETWYDLTVPEATTLKLLKGNEMIRAELFTGLQTGSDIIKNGEQQIKIGAILFFYNAPIPGIYFSRDLEVTVNFN